MRAVAIRLVGSLLVVLGCPVASAWARPTAPSPSVHHPDRVPLVVDAHGGSLLHGAAPNSAKAAADTFYLYGGPGSLAGKFETANLQPTRQDWIGVDGTDPSTTDSHWQLSSFNAANLGAAPAYWSGPYTVPAMNDAMWLGVPAGTAGYATPPGYGNNWLAGLQRAFPVANPGIATTVTWDFVFNHDTEPTYDFIHFQWNAAGTWTDLAVFDGTNRDTAGTFTTPETFHASWTVSPGMYTGQGFNQIQLRMHFQSDGGWSDEDGLFPSDGALQVDNIQVVADNGIGLSQATFEGGDDGGWVGSAGIGVFVGDFSKVLGPLGCQNDPCRQNLTPQMTFIDDGTPPNNDPLGRSTGGSVSPGGYPLPDCWVVNFTGGLSDGTLALHNEVWSPPIDWDLEGVEDDGVEGGAFLRYTVYAHLPLANGIFYHWSVRSRPDPATGGWSPWRDRNFVYWSGRVEFQQSQLDVRDLLVPAPTQVQVALGVRDLADVFGFGGNDATVAPCFDNVAFGKYEAVGPRLTARTVDIFQDGFAESGAAGCAAPEGDYAIRIDMARDIRPGGVPQAVAGDSIVVDVVARKPGASVDTTSIFLEFVLQAQEPDRFATARAAALAALGAQQIAPNRWRAAVPGRRARTSAGIPVADRWSFDLPDGATTTASYQQPEDPLLFPGDQLRYLVRAATVNPSEAALMPPDTTGFDGGGGYSRVFTIHGLPTLKFTAPTTCTQPDILVWNELGHLGGEDELLLAFGQNGLREGHDFDVYTPKGPTTPILSTSNGLGGVHGASAAQLSGYGYLFYESGDLTSSLISDGSGYNGNDKGDDVSVLTAWMAQPAKRAAAFWGDNIASGLVGGGVTYRYNVMGVELSGNDVRSSIGNQTAPRVAPTVAGVSNGFGTSFHAYGGCPGLNSFDNIRPWPATAVKAHEFLGPTGSAGVYVPAASVYYARTDTIAAQPFTRRSFTFPYGLCYVQDVVGSPGSGGRSARANLVREVLIISEYPQSYCVLDDCIDAPAPTAARRLVVGALHPNPFNPVTEFAITVPVRGKLTVHLYNLRGERVSTLLDGDVDAGEHRLQWRGVDGRGQAVASGVYLLEVSGFGQREVRKLALVR